MILEYMIWYIKFSILNKRICPKHERITASLDSKSQCNVYSYTPLFWLWIDENSKNRFLFRCWKFWNCSYQVHLSFIPHPRFEIEWIEMVFFTDMGDSYLMEILHVEYMSAWYTCRYVSYSCLHSLVRPLKVTQTNIELVSLTIINTIKLFCLWLKLVGGRREEPDF